MKPRKPGAGLGHLFPEEGPTHKMPIVDTEERVKCPTCDGSTLIDGATCPDCEDGRVLARHALKKAPRADK